MSKEGGLSFGLLAKDEQRFLESFAKVSPVEDRMALVGRLGETRMQVEAGEKTTPPFEGFNVRDGDVESRIALFIYGNYIQYYPKLIRVGLLSNPLLTAF